MYVTAPVAQDACMLYLYYSGTTEEGGSALSTVKINYVDSVHLAS